MNLRQKAKYHKKKYEQTKANYFNPSLISAHTIQTEKIRASTMIPAEILKATGTDADDIIANILVNTMKNDIKPYMKITNDYVPEYNMYRFYASVRLVKGYEYGF